MHSIRMSFRLPVSPNLCEHSQEDYIPLHTVDCEGLLSDTEDMKRKLEADYASLERPEILRDRTPLLCAIIAKHDLCIKFLLKNGAQVFPKNHSILPLRAALCGLPDETTNHRVKMLLKYGSKQVPYKRFKEHMYDCLRDACASNLYECAEYFLKYGAPTYRTFAKNKRVPHIVTSISTSPAFVAAKEGYGRCFKLLLLNGAILDFTKYLGLEMSYHDPIMVIIAKTRLNPTNTLEMKVKLMKMVHAFGGNLWEKNYFGFTILDILRDDQRVPDETRDMLYETLTELMKEPLSLKQLSRVALVHHLKKRYIQTVPKLEVPRELSSFLEFEDVSP